MSVTYDSFMSILRAELRASRAAKSTGRMSVNDVLRALSRVRDPESPLIYDDGQKPSDYVQLGDGCAEVEDAPFDDERPADVADFARDLRREAGGSGLSLPFVRKHRNGARSFISRIAVDSDVCDDLWGGVPRVVMFCVDESDLLTFGSRIPQASPSRTHRP